MVLDAPPDQGRSYYPYHLELKEAVSHQVVTDGIVHDGVRYKIFLHADEQEVRKIEADGPIGQRWIYVFAIDKTARAPSCFRPPAAAPKEIICRWRIPAGFPIFPASKEDYDFEGYPPFGTDTYIMLATDDRFPMCGCSNPTPW